MSTQIDTQPYEEYYLGMYCREKGFDVLRSKLIADVHNQWPTAHPDTFEKARAIHDFTIAWFKYNQLLYGYA